MKEDNTARPNTAAQPDYETLRKALQSDEMREKLVFCDQEICNEVISRYMEELERTAFVPSVRGFSALAPVSKPRTLSDAKRIVDNT